jgi:imidazolonepropionase-like amidohydrolase
VRRAFRADTAFDGERVLPGGVLVLVEDGRFAAVAPAGTPPPPGWELVYEPGTTLLPGLIDAHTHLCGNSAPDALDRLPHLSDAELDTTVDEALAINLAAGVTALRDLGDQNWAVVDRHRDRPGRPAVVASGPPITVPGGHCATMGGAARGAEDLRRAVRERAERGAGLVKIMTTGGMMTAGTDVRACQFSLEELRAVVDEAHRLGLPVTAHAHALPGVEQCVAAGVDGIEHCTCLGPDGMRTPPGLATAIAAAGIVVCPTVGTDFGPAAVPPPEATARLAELGFSLADGLKHVGDLHRAGITLISGVDSGINPFKPHGFLPGSVAALVDCGVPEVVALASATGLAADACGLTARTGRLRAGLDADLLLVRGDPSRDIKALSAIHTVVRAGHIAARP